MDYKLQKIFKIQGLIFELVEPSVKYRHGCSIFNERFDKFVDNFSHIEKINFLNSYSNLEKLLTDSDEATKGFISESKKLIEEGKLKDSADLIKQINEYLLARIKNYPVEFTQFNEAYSSYLNKRKIAIEIFFQDTDNAKALFELCLDRKYTLLQKLYKLLFYFSKKKDKGINYSLNNENDIFEFDRFTSEVSTAFFLSRMKIERESNRHRMIFQTS